MAEPKNPFDFGTGSIDKDQWQRDIDNEQDAFIARYQNATSKKRGLLLRQAFQDLRKRIANGDMLNRTADGQYQFGSALLREDADMKEAYQRALGFMGDLARRQIQAPPAEPEKKKYSSKTLNDRFIRYFNPSGSQESFTSLWNSYDDTKRKQQLQDFLRSELGNLEKNYQDVEDYDSMDNLKTRINEFLSDPSLTNLNRLGFNRNYLNQLQTEEQQEETPKSELEQVQADIAAAQEAQQVQQGKQYLNWQKYKGNPQKWEFETRPYDYQGMFDYNRKNGNIKTSYQFQTPNFGNFSLTPFQDRSVQDTNKLREGFDKQNTELITNYLKDLGVKYSTMAGQARLGAMLGMLQSSFTVGDKTATPYASQMSKYFTPMQNGAYYINGSANKETGRYAFYTPKQIGAYAPGIHEVSILDLDDPAVRQALGAVQSNKQGGVIEKFDGGGEISDQDWANYLNKVEPKTTKSSQTETVPQDTNEKMDLGDIANVAVPLALDITSMLSANGIGIGTAISAGSGLASTVWQGINDWDNNNVLGSLGSIGANLLADGVGIIPGLGISGKVGKIATGLAKHAKYLGYAFNAIGAKDASQVLYKGIKNGFDLSPDEWKTLLYGLAGVTQGAAGVKRANRINLKRGAATQQVYNSTNKKGETYPVVVGIGDATPGKTGKHRYVANKNDILEVREKTLTPDWSGSMDRSFVKIMQQPRSSVILHPWESLNNPFRNPFSLEKSRNKFNSFAEQWRKRKGKPSNTTETPSEKYGGILKALRNGGIIKAKWGDDTSDWMTPQYNPEIQVSSVPEIQTPLDPDATTRSNYRQTINFGTATPTFFIDQDITKAKQDQNRGNTLNPSRGRFSVPAAGQKTQQNYKSAMDAQLAYYNNNGGKDIMGDVYKYYATWKQTNPTGNYDAFVTDYNQRVEEIRDLHKTKFELGPNGKPKHQVNEEGWGDFNTKHHTLYPSYGKYKNDKGEISDDWDSDPKIVNMLGESTWRRLPNAFDDDNDRKDSRSGFLKEGDDTSYIHMKNDGTLEFVQAPTQKKALGDGTKKAAVDEEIGNKSIFEPQYKNPIDPTLGIIAAKTAMGLAGNRNIYKNLLDEMPQAPLRGPIDRKLAIVGWQEQLKQGQNQLADLRRIQQMQQGVDQQTNFATALETDRVGRDIMNDKLMKDSGRQFETAQKSWNLDNEDTLYNVGVGDANRRAIADRARMMAQIRAAWRSGDNNIKMRAISDTGNWLKQKYQREQDIVDLARKEQLGTREQFMENQLLQNPNYEALKTEYETTKDANRKKEIAAEIQKMKVEVLRKAPSDWAQKIYSIFHTPGFGGGYKESLVGKDGTKLEVAKLKARSKDNDRYVSMMKDLRTTRSRRRRRRFYYED